MTLASAEVLEIKKTCKKCGEKKTLSEFWKNSRSIGGYVFRCKSCSNARRKLKLKRRTFASIKPCIKCGIEKSLSEFPKHKGCGIDGHLNECKKCIWLRQKKYSQEWNKDHKERIRFYSRRWVLKTKYNLSIEAYTELFNSQKGKCVICSSDMELMNHHTHVDHCHRTGKVRGILCRECNRGLGAFKDNENFLREAINYLLRSRMV